MPSGWWCLMEIHPEPWWRWKAGRTASWHKQAGKGTTLPASAIARGERQTTQGRWGTNRQRKRTQNKAVKLWGRRRKKRAEQRWGGNSHLRAGPPTRMGYSIVYPAGGLDILKREKMNKDGTMLLGNTAYGKETKTQRAHWYTASQLGFPGLSSLWMWSFRTRAYTCTQCTRLGTPEPSLGKGDPQAAYLMLPCWQAGAHSRVQPAGMLSWTGDNWETLWALRLGFSTFYKWVIKMKPKPHSVPSHLT